MDEYHGTSQNKKLKAEKRAKSKLLKPNLPIASDKKKTLADYITKPAEEEDYRKFCTNYEPKQRTYHDI